MTDASPAGSGTGLVVALDHSDLAQAESLSQELAHEKVSFKVGLTLFGRYGPEAVRRITRHGQVFCDLKLHDIPQQVEGAAAALAACGAWMVSVHASGGSAMVQAAAEGLASSAEPPILAAVTVLTSLSGADLESLGQGGDPEEQVLRLARLAAGSGADAIICSPREVSIVRAALGSTIKIVCPGVRPESSLQGDQARTLTPGQAARAGADYVVVGRPITESGDPPAAARAIISEITAVERLRGPGSWSLR